MLTPLARALCRTQQQHRHSINEGQPPDAATSWQDKLGALEWDSGPSSETAWVYKSWSLAAQILKPEVFHPKHVVVPVGLHCVVFLLACHVCSNVKWSWTRWVHHQHEVHQVCAPLAEKRRRNKLLRALDINLEVAAISRRVSIVNAHPFCRKVLQCHVVCWLAGGSYHSRLGKRSFLVTLAAWLASSFAAMVWHGSVSNLLVTWVGSRSLHIPDMLRCFVLRGLKARTCEAAAAAGTVAFSIFFLTPYFMMSWSGCNCPGDWIASVLKWRTTSGMLFLYIFVW